MTFLSRHRGWTLLLAFVAYTILACITLWTLLGQFNSAVPGGKDTDYYQFLWNYWWIGHAFSNGVSPLWTDYTLYPHVSNLTIHTLAPIWYPIYAITQPFIGTLASGNLMVLLSFSLTGTAMFAWLRRRMEQGTWALPLAFLGGVAFAFSPYMLTHTSYTQLNLTPLWWFPVILLLWDEIAFPRRFPRWTSALLLALALWGLWLTDLQFIVWLPFASVGYILWTLWISRHNREWLRLVGCGLLAGAIMFGLAYIYPLNALLQINLDPNEYPPAGLKTLYAYSMPPEALIGLAPNVETKTLGHILPWLTWGALFILLLQLLWGRLVAPKPDTGAPSTGPQPPLFFWLGFALIPLIFALGPDVTIAGTRVPMPYLLLHIALNGQYRIPGRMTGVGLFLLITFLVLAWNRILSSSASRFRPLPMKWGWGVGILLSLLIMADVGALNPFPTKSIPDYAIHHQIAGEPGDFVIMDVPVGTQYGWTGIGPGYYSMYYGTVHHHKMVNGWLARIPYSTLNDYIQSPLFSWLADVRDPTDMEVGAAANELAEYREGWPIGYIIAYRNWIDIYKQTRWIGWLNMQPGFCPADSTPVADLVWWRNASLGCSPIITERVDMGTSGDWVHIGEGWYDPESIGGPAGRWANETAALRLTLYPEIAYELTFTALAFDMGRTVTFGNGDTAFTDPIPLTDENWMDYTLTIPAGELPDGLLYLRHNGAISAQERGLSDDSRPVSAAYTRFILRPLNQ